MLGDFASSDLNSNRGKTSFCPQPSVATTVASTTRRMRGRWDEQGSSMCADLLESMAGARLTCVPVALYKKCEPIATKTLTAVSLTLHNRFATVRPWPLLEDCRSPGPTWPTS